jgi:hypothetical protein
VLRVCERDQLAAESRPFAQASGLNFLAFDRVVHVPALEPGPAALAEGILQESVECSGGGRLRDVAGQMVLNPAVITARLSGLLDAMAGQAERVEQALELGCPGLPGGSLGSPCDILRAAWYAFDARIRSRRRSPSPSTAFAMLRAASSMIAHALSSAGEVRSGSSRMKVRSALARHRSGDTGGVYGFKPSVWKAPSALAL